MKTIKIFPILLLLITSYVYADSSFFVPDSKGSIEEVYKGESNKTVILIKDAHCNYEVQKNIISILDNLIEKNKLNLICVEGAQGRIVVPEGFKKELSDPYLKKGILSAPEALLMSRDDISVWGVEDIQLYNDNLLLFKETIKDNKESSDSLKRMERIIASLKRKNYNPQLMEFDKECEKYKNNRIELSDWVLCIGLRTSAVSAYKNVDLAAELIRLEDEIDYSKIESEWSSLLSRLQKDLPEQEMKKFVKNYYLFNKGDINQKEYCGYLKEKMPDGYSFPNLTKYIESVNAKSQINCEELFTELTEMESEIYDSLSRTDAERRIHKMDYDLDVAKRMLELTATRLDINYYKNNSLDADILRRADLRTAEMFYELALERDEEMLFRALGEMDYQGKDTAAVVVGGFHAAGMAEILKGMGVSYVIISPAITTVQKDNPYMSIMMGEVR